VTSNSMSVCPDAGAANSARAPRTLLWYAHGLHKSRRHRHLERTRPVHGGHFYAWSPFGLHHLRLAFMAGNHIGFIGFCQVVEAETLSRRASALLQSSLPLRRPAPCPSLRPNSRIGCSSRGGTRARSADAAEVGRAGPEDRPRRATVAQGREMCTPACDTRVAAAAAARSHPGYGGHDSDGVPRQAASRAWRRRSSAIEPCSSPGGQPASLCAACGSPSARPVGGASLAPGYRGRGRPAPPPATGHGASRGWSNRLQPRTMCPQAEGDAADGRSPGQTSDTMDGRLHGTR
jgi:hypothetical protein